MTEVKFLRLSDFVVRDAIAHDLKAATKPEVIRELVASLHSAGYFKVSEVEDVIQCIVRREHLGSTGIGRAVAIPHSKHPTANRPLSTVGISRGGVPFDSLDGELVHVFVLLVSPSDRPDYHLRALEKISRSLRDDLFVRSLREAATPDAIWALLDKGDGRS